MKKPVMLSVLITTILVSCVRPKDIAPPITTVNLEEVHATFPNTDMTLRQGWNLIVGNKDYSYSINAQGITGNPGNDAYVMDVGNNSFPVYFYRRDFPPNDKNDFTDQSTKQNIVRADGLEALYTGDGSKKINVHLKHRLMLVDFEVQGTQQELRMSINGGLMIKPYQLTVTRFQVIILGSGGTGMHLFIGNKRYDALVNTDPFVADQHKKFVVRYNAQHDTIAVLNGPVSTWSAERWPE